jgi:hypothetical protein
MEVRARRTFGDAGELGDLVMTVALDVVQNENGASPLRQTRERPFKIDATFIHGFARRGLEHLVVARGGDPTRATELRTALGEHDIDGNVPKPGRERTLPSKAREPLPSADEHVLGELFGMHRVGGETNAERVDAADVVSVKTLEGDDVAGLSSRYRGIQLARQLRCPHLQSEGGVVEAERGKFERSQLVNDSDAPSRLRWLCKP